MPRKPLTPEEQLMKLFMQEDDPELETVQKLHRERQNQEDQIIEAEAVLLYFDLNGKGFIKQKCPECKRIFAYKYTIGSIAHNKPKKGEVTVTYIKYAGSFRCSTECRRASLKSRGIEWNPHKRPEDRWGMTDQRKGAMPIIIPPDALETVESALQAKAAHNNSSAP